jgi:hypothetical protein
MRTLTSTFPYAGTIPSALPQKMRLPKEQRTPSKVVRATLIDPLTRFLDGIRSETSEVFYQNHVFAIYMGIYIEIAMAPLVTALGIYLFNY